MLIAWGEARGKKLNYKVIPYLKDLQAAPATQVLDNPQLLSLLRTYHSLHPTRICLLTSYLPFPRQLACNISRLVIRRLTLASDLLPLWHMHTQSPILRRTTRRRNTTQSSHLRPHRRFSSICPLPAVGKLSLVHGRN